MKKTTGFYLAAFLIFGLYNAVSAQPIFIPFQGRREAIKAVDFTPGEINLLKTGKTCGRYFSYEEVADQKIVSFKVPVSEAESRRGVNDFNRVVLNLLQIKIDNRLKIPVIEYRAPKLNARKKSLTSRKLFIISLSAQDFREAACLSKLR